MNSKEKNFSFTGEKLIRTRRWCWKCSLTELFPNTWPYNILTENSVHCCPACSAVVPWRRCCCHCWGVGAPSGPTLRDWPLIPYPALHRALSKERVWSVGYLPSPFSWCHHPDPAGAGRASEAALPCEIKATNSPQPVPSTGAQRGRRALSPAQTHSALADTSFARGTELLPAWSRCCVIHISWKICFSSFGEPGLIAVWRCRLPLGSIFFSHILCVIWSQRFFLQFLLLYQQ